MDILGLLLFILISAAPLVALGWFLVYLPLRRARVRRQLPALADELGLTLDGPGASRAIATLRGKLGGRKLTVDRRIKIEGVPGSGRVLLSFHGQLKRDKFRRFDFSDPLLDKTFKTRAARKDGAAMMCSHIGPKLALIAFVEQWRGRVKDLRLGWGHLECTLKRGSILWPYYIEPDDLRQILPALEKLIEAFERA